MQEECSLSANVSVHSDNELTKRDNYKLLETK